MGNFMDTGFWVGLLLGAIFSFAASVIANLYSEQIKSWTVERSNTSKLNKLSKEQRTYGRVLRMRRDAAFRAAFFMQYLVNIIAALFTATLSVILLGPQTLLQKTGTFGEIVDGVLVGFALVSVIYSTLMMGWILDDARLLRDFDEYRKRLIAKWPDERWEAE
jgi:hypothetical protein